MKVKGAEHRRILDAWVDVIHRAILLGDADAARNLTMGLVQRLRELGYPVCMEAQHEWEPVH
jgi:hypothetical protein